MHHSLYYVELGYSLVLHNKKGQIELTFTVVPIEPVSTLTVVPVRIIEVHHTRASILARRCITHVWTNNRRPQSIHKVCPCPTGPTHAIFWRSDAMFVIGVSDVVICPALTVILYSKVFVVHITGEIRAPLDCFIWIWRLVCGCKTGKLDVQESIFFLFQITSQGNYFGKWFWGEKRSFNSVITCIQMRSNVPSRCHFG